MNSILAFVLGISLTINAILIFIFFKIKDKKEIDSITVNKEERNSFFS